MIKRGSGILLHLTSLPSPHGIGDLGPLAYKFVDFLHSAHQMYWQILPANPTEEINGHSPYSSISAFAGNTLLISLDVLIEEDFLSEKDIKPVPEFSEHSIEYSKVISYKEKMLDKAFENFETGKKAKKNVGDFERFCSEHAHWLEDFALFVLLKKKFEDKGWSQWPDDFKYRDPNALGNLRQEKVVELKKARFIQYLFFRQWSALKAYGEKKGVKVIGDIPIYVNYDSAEVWANPGLFKLDKQGQPKFVGGVPPDYFSETGQRWGNPIYQWDELKRTGYFWWIQRIKHNLTLFDYIRIDHFRGFAAYWQIPVEEKTAVNGHWLNGPGEDFFKVLQKAFPGLPIIAEDMGIITPDVTALMNAFGFPGMKVLLFAFGDDLDRNPYLPHNHLPNAVVYTGTHDNNTVQGWFLNDLSSQEQRNLVKYFGQQITAEDINDKLINLVMNSVCNLALVPLQDWLGAGKEARMNTPGTIQGNWRWRVSLKFLTPALAKKIAALTTESHRV